MKKNFNELAVFQAELRICEFHSEGTTKLAMVYKSIDNHIKQTNKQKQKNIKPEQQRCIALLRGKQ